MLLSERKPMNVTQLLLFNYFMYPIALVCVLVCACECVFVCVCVCVCDRERKRGRTMKEKVCFDCLQECFNLYLKSYGLHFVA